MDNRIIQTFKSGVSLASINSLVYFERDKMEYIAAGTYNNQITIWNLSFTNSPVITLPGRKKIVSAPYFCVDEFGLTLSSSKFCVGYFLTCSRNGGHVYLVTTGYLFYSIV